MKNIANIVLMVLSALVLIISIVLHSGWEINLLGALLTVVSVANFIFNKKAK